MAAAAKSPSFFGQMQYGPANCATFSGSNLRGGAVMQNLCSSVLTPPWLNHHAYWYGPNYKKFKKFQDLYRGTALTFENNFSQNTTRALTQIRHLVDGGDLPSDGRLPTERELSERFGCSRRTIRHALEVLETEGLLWRRRGKGTFAGQPPRATLGLASEIVDEVDALGVMEARMGIEPQLAALCARRATGEDVDRLRLLAERTIGSQDSDTSELWDGAIHRQIARIAGNALLEAAFDIIDTVRMDEDWQQKRHMARSTETSTLYHQQHIRIIDAIDARDAEAARAAMTQHLQSLTDNLRRALAQSA